MEGKMVKDRKKKKGLTRTKPAAAKSGSKKKTAAVKPTAKRARRAAAGKPPTDTAHHAVFKSLAARSNQHNLSPVCYQELASGSWTICFLQSDGKYGQCQPYNGPIHQPPCG
jgi:hypothetical protein